MKLLRYIFLLALIPLLSCEDKYVSGGRDFYTLYFKEVLRDPESFTVYKEEFAKDGVTVNWKIEYGAKNGFGGMVREVVEFSTIGELMYINGSCYERKKDKVIKVY